jgi:hypothetical protein
VLRADLPEVGRMHGAGALAIRRFVVIQRSGDLWGFNRNPLVTRELWANAAAAFALGDGWTGIDDSFYSREAG